MRIGAAFLLVLILGTTAAEARQERILSEDEAVRLALRNDHTVEGALADADAAGAASDQAWTLRFPMITADGTYTRLSDNVSSLDIELPPGIDPGAASSFELTPIELDQIQTAVNITQPLVAGGRIGASIGAARHLAEAAGFSARGAEVDAAFRVRAAYWNLVRAEAAAAAVEAGIAQLESHLRDAENRLAEGAATRSEVLQVRTRVEEVRVDRVDAENAVAVTRMELNRLTGLPLDTPTRPAPVTAREDRPGDFPRAATDAPLLRTALLDSAMVNHPALLASRYRSMAMNERIGVARADWFPQITAFGRYRYSRPNPYFFLDQDEFRGSWEAGIAATWTIWDWNSRGAAIDRARAELRSASAAEAELQSTIELEVERRRLEAIRAAAALSAAQTALESARESFRIARGEYELGAALTSQVLDAEADLRSAELRVAGARADLAVADALILQVLGRIR